MSQALPPYRARAERAATEIADDMAAELVQRLGSDALDGWRRVTDALIEMYLSGAPTMVRVAAQISSSPG